MHKIWLMHLRNTSPEFINVRSINGSSITLLSVPRYIHLPFISRPNKNVFGKVQKYISFICSFITFCIILLSCEFPSLCNLSPMCPVFKSCDNTLIKNYRPIFINCYFPEVFQNHFTEIYQQFEIPFVFISTRS